MNTRITAKDLLCLDANALANVNQITPNPYAMGTRISTAQMQQPLSSDPTQRMLQQIAIQVELHYRRVETVKTKFRTVLRNFNSQEQGKIIEAVNFYAAYKNYLEPRNKDFQESVKSMNEGIEVCKQAIKDLTKELRAINLETKEGKAAFEALRQKAKNMYDNLKKVERKNLSPFMSAMAQTKNMAEEGIAMADPFIRDLNSINNARIQRNHAIFLEGFDL